MAKETNPSPEFPVAHWTGQEGCMKFTETPLEMAYGREINIQFTATALVDIPAVSMPIARTLKTCDICGNVIKLHILEWPFVVASLRHTCAIIMLSNQHLGMTVGWMDYLGKGEVLTNTDLDRFVNNI